MNAAHSFYNGTTTLPISDEDRTPRKRISKTLNMTTSPEEKRKIIGDTFVKVMYLKFMWKKRIINVFYLRLLHSEALCTRKHGVVQAMDDLIHWQSIETFGH